MSDCDDVNLAVAEEVEGEEMVEEGEEVVVVTVKEVEVGVGLGGEVDPLLTQEEGLEGGEDEVVCVKVVLAVCQRGEKGVLGVCLVPGTAGPECQQCSDFHAIQAMLVDKNQEEVVCEGFLVPWSSSRGRARRRVRWWVGPRPRVSSIESSGSGGPTKRPRFFL